MLEVNNGGGLYTLTGLIDSVIVNLNEIEVKGIENHHRILDSIQKLSLVKEDVTDLQNGRKGEANDHKTED